MYQFHEADAMWFPTSVQLYHDVLPWLAKR